MHTPGLVAPLPTRGLRSSSSTWGKTLFVDANRLNMRSLQEMLLVASEPAILVLSDICTLHPKPYGDSPNGSTAIGYDVACKRARRTRITHRA